MEALVRDPAINDQATDLLQDCLVCASTVRTVLDDGTPRCFIHCSARVFSPSSSHRAPCCAPAAGVTAVPVDYPVSIAADGMTKACRYSNVATGQKDRPPTMQTYLGPLAEKVITDHANADKTLTSPAQERKRAATADEASCTSALSCNRVTAAARGDTDLSGLMGMVCSHSIPVLGGFVGMVTPEQHEYYKRAFEYLLRNCPEVRTVYLDLACRFKGSWDKLVQRLLEAGAVGRHAAHIKLLLPWMHAFDHNMACQLVFSALYQVRIRLIVLSPPHRSPGES